MKTTIRQLAVALSGLTIALVGAVAIGQAPAPAPIDPPPPPATVAVPTLAPSAATTSTTTPRAAPAVAPSISAPAAKSLPPGPAVNLGVTEWVVFVTDASSGQLNSHDSIKDTLPPFVADQRSEPAPDDPLRTAPAPIGVIRFARLGPIDPSDTIDVELGYKNGRALGHWPSARARSSGLLWQDLSLADPAAAKENPKDPRPSIPAGSWLSELRADDQHLAIGSMAESFLLYDLELPYPMTLQVTGGKEGRYKLGHAQSSPLRDVTLYKPADEGRAADAGNAAAKNTPDKPAAASRWRMATLASLPRAANAPAAPPAAAPATPDATAQAAAQPGMQPGQVVIRGPGGVMIVRAAGAVPLAGAPSGDAATTPAAAAPPAIALKGTELALAGAGQDEAAALAPWRKRLAEAGVSAADQNVVCKILARFALDSKRLTLVYRLDPAEFDKILPLDIVPQPKKVSRIALVVVTGIDPAIGQELDRWIAQLGSPSWKEREAAAAEIKKLGTYAKARLEKAASDKDAEIAYRAEQLLEAITPIQPADAQSPVGGGGAF